MKKMTVFERKETINLIACAGEEVIRETRITFRFGRKPLIPLGALVEGKEVGPEIAAILFEIVTGP
jgi:hypothetical protein